MILQTYEKRQKQPTLYFNEFLDRIKFFHVSIVNHVSSHVCSSGENVHRVLDIPLSDRWTYFKMLGMFTNFYCNTFEGFGLFTSSVNNRKFYFLSSVYSFFNVSQINPLEKHFPFLMKEYLSLLSYHQTNFCTRFSIEKLLLIYFFK